MVFIGPHAVTDGKGKAMVSIHATLQENCQVFQWQFRKPFREHISRQEITP